MARFSAAFLLALRSTLPTPPRVVPSAPLETRLAGTAGGEIAEGPIEILQGLLEGLRRTIV
jgi:hypothetical protein